MAVNITNRADAEAIIREQVVSSIFQDAPKNSVFMGMARKLPNMTSNQTRIRVLDFLPTAYWVDGDVGMKQTTRQAWDNVYLNAGELAVIVPIPDAVLSDAEFDIFGEITPRVMEAIGQAKLRGLRDTTGQPIFKSNMQDVARYTLDGAPITFPENGGFYPEIAQLVVGDFGQAVYSIRQDVTVKILDQGVIQDPATKEIVYNLAQQDMTALRIVFRMGWALPNPATRMNEDRTGCAFAYLEPGTPVVTQKVTFTVTDGKESSPVAYEGVRINVDGAILVTGDDGKAEFNLRAGTYTAKITKKGYISVTETFTVAKAAVTKNITLTSRE